MGSVGELKLSSKGDDDLIQEEHWEPTNDLTGVKKFSYYRKPIFFQLNKKLGLIYIW